MEAKMRFCAKKWKAIRFFKSGESGSAMVETALTLPVFVILLLGAVQLGQIAYASIETTNAARAGVQYAGMNGGGYNDTAGIKAAAQHDAYDIYTPHPTSFTVTPSTSCVCSSDFTTACGLAAGVYSCASGAPVVTVTVQTTASYPSLITVPGLFASNTFTLHGYAQQEVLQ
jgi:Flp pilus assembly protein TadG